MYAARGARTYLGEKSLGEALLRNILAKKAAHAKDVQEGDAWCDPGASRNPASK